MKRMVWCLIPGLLAVSSVRADTLTLNNGRSLTGDLVGYAGRKFEFRVNDGSTYLGYPLDIKSIVPDAPVRASLKFSLKQYDSVEFIQYERNVLKFRKNGQVQNEPVITLKSMRLEGGEGKGTVNPPGEHESPVAVPVGIPAEASAKPRDWKQAGKWRQIEEDQSDVISRGEVVDIDASIKKGFVNIVQFHYPQSLASVREGNYVEALAAKRNNRIVLLKVVVSDFNAPVCVALNIKGLPQFWVYSPQGKLVKKLADRFTEGDIDAAIRDARRF